MKYFTARLMYSLNKFANEEGNYYNNNNCDLHRGTRLTYSNVLPYERVKGKVILLSAFTSTSEIPSVAIKFSGRKNIKSLYNLKKNFQ